MSDIEIDLDGDIDDKVRKMPEVKSASQEAVDKIAAIARDNAPVLDGDYRDGIVTQETKSGWRVLASDQKSAWIEFGIPSRNQPPQFNLRRAVEAAGFKFKKGR
ncbi:hypothetical protein [Glaciihabitans sp. UYNi722]|uniref:hypothetical protein n=1 Tax=Glaciihabitans sp. UYNi722 TaxID=3156344 RepID=UPI0033996EF4